MASCCNNECVSVYKAALSDIPSKWAEQIASLLCQLDDEKFSGISCTKVQECETLTAFTDLSISGNTLSISYRDENENTTTRTLALSLPGNFVNNQFTGPQTGAFWISGTGRAGNFDVTSMDIPDTGISVNPFGGLALSASGVDTTYFDGDGLMTHKGNIFLSAAISSAPAISFFLNSLVNSDYYLQRQGTTLRLHAAGIVALSSNTNIGYTVNSNSLQGHEWYSMTSPTNNNLMQLFPDGSLLLMTTTVQQTPDPSAIFEIDSTTRGFLPSRMTTAQKNAIASPTPGLIVFDTTLDKLCVRTSAGWQTIPSV